MLFSLLVNLGQTRFGGSDLISFSDELHEFGEEGLSFHRHFFFIRLIIVLVGLFKGFFRGRKSERRRFGTRFDDLMVQNMIGEI